jgi:glycosyltransferase involved in cell wall biosynthesis
MSKARGEWLFYVDADERVSEKLRREIIKKINNHQYYVAFMIPRLNIFFGRPMKYGGWFPDYQTRLFKKANLEGFFGKIHESAEVKGNIGKLENPFIHLGHLSITKGFTKSTYWTKIESNLLFEANHLRITIFHLIKATMSEFFNRLIPRRGIKDGTVGWLEGIIQTFNKLLIYSQLWEKQQKSYH